MYKLNGFFRFPTGRHFREFDFRAPEERLTSGNDGEEHSPIWSPAIVKAIVNWSAAKRDDDEDGLKRAAREAIDATAGYYRMSGMPPFAHYPLPPQLVEAELSAARDAPDANADSLVARFIGAFDDSAKPAVDLQVRSLLAGSRADGPPSPMRSIYDTDKEREPHSPILRSLLNEQHSATWAPDTRDHALDDHTRDNVRARVFQPRQTTDGQEARFETLENDALDRVRAQTVAYSGNRKQSDIRVEPKTIFDGRTSDGGYYIRRNFRLSRPADSQRGGYIVQTVRVTIQDVGPDGRPLGRPRTYEYSEAWRVSGGKDRPLEGAQGHPELGVPWANDSIGGPPQNKVSAVMTVTVTTRFYDGMTHLPDDFQRGTVVPGGDLLSTITPIDQLQFTGSPGPATTTRFPPILLKRRGQR